MNEKMGREDYANLDRKLWKSVSGKYGSSTVGVMPALTEIEERYKENPFEEGFGYINLLIADQTSKLSPNATETGNETFYTADSFTVEGIEKTHEVDLFPYYSTKGQRAFHISVFGQSLDNPAQYELLLQQVKIGQKNISTYLKVAPLKGFTNKNGAYRSGYDPFTEKDPWIDNETGSDIAKYEDGTYKFHVYDWSEFRQQRVKSTLTFQSGDDIVHTITDIYYETPLDEYLKEVPVNDDEKMKFAGWYENPDLFEVTQPLTKLTMPPTDLTLYAKWVPIDYTVTFDSHGGTPVEAQSVPSGKCAVVPEEPTKEDYTFAGWYIDDNTRWNFDTQVAGDITLHALWKPIPAEKDYQIRHILQTDGSVVAEYTGTGVLGDTITVRALTARDKDYLEGSYIVPDALSKSIVLTKDGPNEAVFYYDLPNRKDYTVSYLLEGTEQILHEEKKVTDTTLSRVTEIAEEIPGYTPKQNYLTADLTTEGENKIVFYYTEERSASLTISKTVTGEMGDKKKEFAIEIILQKEDGTPVKGSFPIHGADYEDGEQIAFWEDGNAKIALSDGQSVTIRDLEMGVKFSVEETPIPAGYQVTYNGTSSDTGIQGNLEETTKVSIVNAYDKIPVTALNAHIKSGAILILSAGILLLIVGCVMLYKRRKLH